jgi:predicted alpha/beta superfamily hydrolase
MILPFVLVFSYPSGTTLSSPAAVYALAGTDHGCSQERRRSRLVSRAWSSGPVVIGQSIVIPSRVLKERRRVFVSLPVDYAHSKERYATLYVLDGEFHFTHIAGFSRFVGAIGDIPPLIVVGIETADHRVRDFSPKPLRLSPDLTDEEVGGADRFTEFLSSELIPFIERRYRTQPYRMLMGHSMGGLFAVRALWTKPCLFQALIAVDPSLPWGGGAAIREGETTLAARPSLCVKDLYFAAREDWTANHDFARYLSTVLPESVRLYHANSTETHSSLSQSAIHDALWRIFADYRLPSDFPYDSVAAMDAHYSRASARYGFQVPIPGTVFSTVGHTLLERGAKSEAMALFRRSIALYPQSPRAIYNVGVGYEALGDMTSAARAYRQALKVAEVRRVQLFLLPDIRRRLARLLR